MSKTTQNYTQAVGRRKEAVARVRLFKGQGQITVNGKLVSEYFRGPIYQKSYQKPFELTGTLGEYTATAKIEGGGVSSQLSALTHGLSRALTLLDPEKFKLPLRKGGFLTRDSRVKERRKYGLAQKARAKKQSPKR